MSELNELEQDALTEIFNIGVGIAADALYQLAGEQVPLSVPVVALMRQQDAMEHYRRRVQKPLYAIRQTYRGALSTEATLLFPQDKSADLVRLLVGHDLDAAQLAEVTHDAMGELGNIVLNAVISNLCTTLQLPLEGSLPHVSRVDADQVLPLAMASGTTAAQDAPVLALMIDFELSSTQASGYLVFSLDAASSDLLTKRLSHYVSGQGAP